MKGNQTVKEKQENEIKEFLKKAKNTDLYKQVIEKFPDANLVDVKPKNNTEE
jgi:DNA polymerase-3 subunit gamma/tau